MVPLKQMRPRSMMVGAIGNQSREMQVLLGNRNADAFLFMVRDGVGHLLTIFGDSPSEGSSSRISEGLPISVRAMVSICCSPPLIRAAGDVPAFRRD